MGMMVVFGQVGLTLTVAVIGEVVVVVSVTVIMRKYAQGKCCMNKNASQEEENFSLTQTHSCMARSALCSTAFSSPLLLQLPATISPAARSSAQPFPALCLFSFLLLYPLQCFLQPSPVQPSAPCCYVSHKTAEKWVRSASTLGSLWKL